LNIPWSVLVKTKKKQKKKNKKISFRLSTEDGKVYFLGAHNEPVEVKLSESCVTLACGRDKSLIAGISGRIFTHIKGDSVTDKVIFLPLRNEKIVSLSCGFQHFVALTSKGRVFGWGRNVNGQLGMGKQEEEVEPGGKF
jgi:alpha-tubulin suppressor-like RCC1 family protein